MADAIQATTTYAGDPAWQVQGYHLVKRLLSDPRLGRTHPQPERASRYSNSVIFGRPQPASPTEAADHDRMRARLAPSFSPRRMALLRPRVQELVDSLLDELRGQVPPVDFHDAVSFPLPTLVICELLGVPYEDRADFRRWSDDAAHMDDEARSLAGLGALWQYMTELVEAKRRQHGSDVLSLLVAAEAAHADEFGADEVARLGAGLLFAGHETTVAAIDKGVVLLCTDPELRRAVEGEAAVAGAVEEILRLPLPLPLPRPETDRSGGLPRWAKADIAIDGITIRAGDLVLLDLQDANLDAEAFPALAVGDVTGDGTPGPRSHLTFGHGPYFCIGAPLARMELQVLFASLFRWLPGMRLAVAVDDLRPRSHLLTGGLESLPVTW